MTLPSNLNNIRLSEETTSNDTGYPLLRVESLTAPTFAPSKSPIFSDLSLDLHRGEILCIQGPSGVGKSVLLKCIAHLLVFPHGFIYLHGHEAEELKGGIPAWRARVLYLPQRPALLPGTPSEFWETITKYESRKHVRQAKKDPLQIAEEWRIDRSKWNSTWAQLSGGEAQRIALAIGLALQPEVLLLDEPTSALDPETTRIVESTLTTPNEHGRVYPSLIWVTHAEDQAERVATKRFKMPSQQQQV